MPYYDVDYDNKVVTDLPPDYRVKSHIAMLRAFLGQLKDDAQSFFSQYKNGSTDPAYVAGTYALRQAVIFNGAVYKSKIDGNTSDPTDATKWRMIAPSFIGTDERIAYRTQTILVEWALNKWFGTTFRQPPGVSDIYLQNDSVGEPVFVVGVDEAESSDVYGNRSTGDVINAYSFEVQYGYTIYMPVAVYTALGAAAESKVRNFADKYTAAGITYNIVTY